MAEPIPEEGKAALKAARDTAKAAKEAAELLERNKLLAKRTPQLENARIVADKLEKEVRLNQKTAKRCQALSSHTLGIYEEVNKLAKGRTMMEVTPLLVEQANDIIRDAKAIVSEDVYLDRIKEFVPAGNNPVYPDVLLTIRVVRESLNRCAAALRTQKSGLLETLSRIRTVVGSLECFLSGDENGEEASISDVRTYVDGDVDDSCFSWHDQAGHSYFNFDELDSQTLEDYLSMADEDNGSEEGEEREQEAEEEEDEEE